MQVPHIKIGNNLLEDAVPASVEVTQELNHYWHCVIVRRLPGDKWISVENYLSPTLEPIPK
jgi:type VI secretion system secreted protein VgrG